MFNHFFGVGVIAALALFSSSAPVFAAAASAGVVAMPAPTRLTTDLLEHTERVLVGGRLAPALAPDDFSAAPEGRQIAEIRNAAPRLGWNVNSDRPDTAQTACHVLVASSAVLLDRGRGDLWDSGKIASAESVSLPYAGKPLRPARVYFWKVKTWDNHGRESAFSAPKSFVTAAVLDGKTARYPIQISDEKPVRIARRGNIVFVDFGKAAFGKLVLKLTSAAGGEIVSVRLGECITKDGAIDRRPGGTRRFETIRFKLKRGAHDYTTEFRYKRAPAPMPGHIGEVMPFRYCEIENYAGGATLSSNEITRGSAHYFFDEDAASFVSDNTVLNQVWELCKHTMKATSFTGVYIDGDRERTPYEADAYINQLGHYCVDREYAIGRYSHEFLLRNATWPTEWILHSILMARADYYHTGDDRSLRTFYNDLRARTLSALKDDSGLISTLNGKLTKEIRESIHYNGGSFRDIVDWPGSERDGFVFTKYNTVVNAFYATALAGMEDIANVLKIDGGGARYREESDDAKKRFNELFFDAARGVYTDGAGIFAKKRKTFVDAARTPHASLHANIMPLAFGLVPPEHGAGVAKYVRSRGMACSVYAAQYLLEALYKTGAAADAECALALLTKTDERGWYNMLKAGSTITLEAWDNKFKPNQDWNHAWGAAPANIITRKLLGVEPLRAGFQVFSIFPQTASLKHIKATIPTLRGTIKIEINNDGKTYRLTAEIPPNAQARLALPKHLFSKNARLTLDGAEKPFSSSSEVVGTVSSGRHELVLTY